MITGDRYRVPIRDLGRAICESVGDQSKAGFRWIDISSPGDIFFQDVILDRAAYLIEADVLLSCDAEVKA